MSLVRNPQRDDRRRRVLVDAPTRDTQSTGQISTRATRPKRAYTAEALAVGQARITDLLPVRHWSLTVVLLSSLTVIAALEFLHVSNYRWQRKLPEADLSMLDLNTTGNLAAWFSSLLLLGAALLTILIYTIRQHKSDDYRGRYSIWLWAAAGWLLASIDATAGIHRILQAALTKVTGTPLYADGTAWWIAAWSAAFLVLGIRLLMEMWACRVSCGSILAATGCYGVAAAGRLNLFLVFDGPINAMLQGGALLLGHLLLMFSMLLYARHVFLDAQGMVKARRRRIKKKRAAAPAIRKRASATIPFNRDQDDDETSERSKTRKAAAAERRRQRRSSSSDVVEGKEAAQTSSQKESADVEVDGDEDVPPSDDRKLSKSERKRLRKQRRRERRAA
jgi:hypothetical protein